MLETLTEITPRNILSFGPDTEPIPLGNLSVVLDESGKATSDFLEIVRLLKSLCWKGKSVFYPRPEFWERSGSWAANGTLAARFQIPLGSTDNPYALYTSELGYENQTIQIIQEERHGYCMVEHSWGKTWLEDPGDSGIATLAMSVVGSAEMFTASAFRKENLLAKRKKVRLINGILDEDLANLLFLLEVNRKDLIGRIDKELRAVFPDFMSISIKATEDKTDLVFKQGGMDIPASQVDAARLKYMALAAILSYPRCIGGVPRLICIEEPEHGLSLDMLVPLAGMLERAAEHYQLIITMRSPVLAEALSHRPETVLTCDSSHGVTQIRRRLLAGATA